MERTVERYPRRPPNAFFLFSIENRRKLIDENPGLGNREVSALLGSLWSKLDSHKKQEFITKAKEMKAKHMKEYPGYKLNPWSVRRLRDKQRNTTNKNKSSNMILWRPSTLLQMSLLIESTPEPQINNQLVREIAEPISDEKQTFFRCLGLCQRNSSEYFNIEAKHSLNVRKYHIFTFIQTVGVHNSVNCKINVVNESQTPIKRPRGRPPKH